MALILTMNSIYQRAKNIIHALQALLIFVAAMITIAIFTKDGQSDTRITYYFALCFICIPFLIYQTAFPTFQRSKRFTNAYAHAIIDLLLSILWFAAFIAEIVWAKNGTQAAKDFKSGDGTCQVFGYGPTDKCHLGQVTMVFGIVICILFAVTTAFSAYGVNYYRSHGTLPGNNNPTNPGTIQSDDLEFNGADPNAYVASQQQMQQQPVESHNDGYVSPVHSHEEEGNATLPPRPLYSKAPQLPPQHGFEPVDTSYHGVQAHDPHQYNPGPGPYQEYGYESGDYTLPSQHSPRTAELPTLRVDIRPRYGPGGENLPFPAADYGR